MRRQSAPYKWLSDDTLRAMVRDFDAAAAQLSPDVALEPIAVRDERHWLYGWRIAVNNELHERDYERFCSARDQRTLSLTPE